jgi:hypothetical protein
MSGSLWSLSCSLRSLSGKFRKIAKHELTPGLPPEAGQALSASQRGVPLFNFAILRFCNPSSRYLSDFQLPQSPAPSTLNLESLAPYGRCLKVLKSRKTARPGTKQPFQPRETTPHPPGYSEKKQLRDSVTKVTNGTRGGNPETARSSAFLEAPLLPCVAGAQKC